MITPETVHLTAVVTKLVKQFQLLELGFGAEYQAPHEVEKIADALEAALKSDAQVVFYHFGSKKQLSGRYCCNGSPQCGG